MRVAFVPVPDVPRAHAVLNRHAPGEPAVCIGKVSADQPPLVVLQTAFGPGRILDMPTGEQLPRIC